MTKIVGTIRDAHLSGVSGLMVVWSGFRATTTTVIAPRRREWEITHGEIPEGVVVAAGPAVIQLDFGPSAHRSWPVEVPDQDEITIQELLLQSVPWGPDVVTPPPEQVADLLRMIAESSEQYRLALWADTDRALDQIALSVAMAQAVEVSGQEYSSAAQEHMAAALRYALDSLAAAQEASDRVDEARGALSATELLRDEAQAVRDRIESLSESIDGTADRVDLSSAEALAAAAAAAESSDLAQAIVNQSETIRAQIERHMEDAQAAVAEGERQVARAMERAEDARAAAADAGAFSDQAQGLVDDANTILDSTQTARDEAQSALTSIEGIGTEVDLIQTQVLALHDETLARHQEVLAAHAEAISAASDAASSAGEAAEAATDTAVHAANAADEALSATAANAAAQATFQAQQEQFNEDYADRVLLQAMMLEAVREAQAAAHYERWHIVTAPGRNGSGSDDNVAIGSGTGAINVTAKGTWVGRMIIHAGWEAASPGGGGTRERIGDYRIPQPDGSRMISMDRDATHTNFNRVWARVDYTIDPAVQRLATTEVGRFVTTGGVVQIPDHTFTAGAGGRDYAVTFTVRWPYANFLERFVARIYLNGTMVGEYSKYNVGPLFGEAARTRSVTVTGLEMESGDQLTFHAGTSGGGNQEITDPSSTRVTWIEGG